MKIINIRTERYEWPRKQPITNGKHTYTHSGVGFVFVDTDEGITGVGIGAGKNDIVGSAIDYFSTLLIGEDPINVEHLWHKMWVPKLVGRRGLTTRAISAIDIALWDLRSKVAGLPLYKMLGGFSNRVPSYIAGGYFEKGKGLKELQREVSDHVSAGAKAVKIKVGAIPISADVERVKAVREAIGPEIKLMIDANCAYKWYEAIQLAERVEEFQPFWFEEPIAPDDYEGHKRIVEKTSIPIATGENEYTRYGFRDLISTGCVPILNADAMVMGGVTEFMKVAALAQAYDLDIAPHGAQEVHVHLVSAISNGLIVEFYPEYMDPMWGKVYQHTLQLNDDGTISPPNVPGIGLEPQYENLEEFRVG